MSASPSGSQLGPAMECGAPPGRAGPGGLPPPPPPPHGTGSEGPSDPGLGPPGEPGSCHDSADRTQTAAVRAPAGPYAGYCRSPAELSAAPSDPPAPGPRAPRPVTCSTVTARSDGPVTKFRELAAGTVTRPLRSDGPVTKFRELAAGTVTRPVTRSKLKGTAGPINRANRLNC
eukprot:686126-Hanusia_phi.AAC.1